jgi:hypothetical protein
MGLLNTDNVEPQDSEELWVNNPDPYDLAETDRVDADLQATIIRSSTLRTR